MGGRNRGFDGQWALVETTFILDDERLDLLTPAQRWLYLTLWVYAVQERRSRLPRSALEATTLGRRSRLDPRTVPQALAKLLQIGRASGSVESCHGGVTEASPSPHGGVTEASPSPHPARTEASPSPHPARTEASPSAKLLQICSDNPLLIEHADGSVTVCGVKSKHPNLKWRDDDENGDINDFIPPHKCPQAQTQTQTEEQAQPPKKTSAARPDYNLVCESIRKNTNQEPSPKTVQKILVMCEKADLDPVGVVELAEKPLLNPVAWVQAACRDPDGWLDRAGGWGRFQERLGRPRDGPETLDMTEPEAMGGIIQRAMRQVQGGTG